MNGDKVINKTMDFRDFENDVAKEIISELNNLIIDMKRKGLKISSWYGKFDLSGNLALLERINRGYNYKEYVELVDDKNFPWFLYWEIVWVIMNAGFKKTDKILDLGGSSSLFSFYLASQGIEVVTVDLQQELVDNANYVAMQMDWDLKNYAMDIRKLNMERKFDHITSICVYEHIPMYDRIDINRSIKDLLVDGGKFSITFDYRNPSRFAFINTQKDVYEQFVQPSGLAIRGCQEFIDSGQNYLLHPFFYPGISWMYKWQCIRSKQFGLGEILKTKEANDYTFGSLFLEKENV